MKLDHLNSELKQKDEVAWLKLQEMEHKKLYKRGIRIGFLGAISTMLIVFIIISGLVWINRDAVIYNLGSRIGAQFIDRLFSSFPEGYVTKNREFFISSLDDFTNAVSHKAITPDEFKIIGKTILNSLKDGYLRYSEIDSILSMMSRFSQADKKTYWHVYKKNK